VTAVGTDSACVDVSAHAHESPAAEKSTIQKSIIEKALAGKPYSNH
jgi:hypothetical protein